MRWNNEEARKERRIEEGRKTEVVERMEGLIELRLTLSEFNRHIFGGKAGN